MRRHFLYVVIAAVLCSCTKNPVEIYYKDQRAYYDIPKFINAQSTNLDKKKQWVRKTVTKDGRTHIIERGDIEWNDELSAFIDSDINRPAWRGSFKVDTISLDRVWVITYKTEVSEIPVKNVVVTMDKESKECLQVTVDKSTENFLYTSNQKLFYTTGEGYMLKGKLSVTYLFESEYAIESEFVEI
ncbi:hypothetical protein ACFLR1_03750 [Bacteroidota bacterium]